VSDLDKLYEGKAKIVYPTERTDEVRIVFKDDATAGDGAKRARLPGKGQLNAAISATLFRVVEEAGVPTHFVRSDGPDAIIVKRLRMLPVEVVVRNLAAGSLARRLGLQAGTVLRRPVLEHNLKNDALHDPWVNATHVEALGIATAAELAEADDLAMQVDQALEPYLAARGLILVDFKLEFGRDGQGVLRLGDEISPDTCRLWDSVSRTPLDKDRFRQDLGGVVEAYREVWRRLLGEGGERG
jgi:phosphoribosylaminoimidazole-succinocarboxamide synthase